MIAKSRIVRLFWFILGWIAFILGTIGIAIPILPTVPFYLLTSFCFVRSSEKFNTWFLHTKLYKNHIKGFATNRAMTLKGELMLLLLVSLMLMITMYFTNNLHVTIVLTILIFCKYLYFVLRVNPVNKAEFALINRNHNGGESKNDK